MTGKARLGTRIMAVPAVPAVWSAGAALAADAGVQTVNTGNTAWVITASALVLFMTLPGLALFYGGLVRSRNFLSVLMQCFVITCLVSVVWSLVGYSLAFGTVGRGWIGGLDKLFLANLDAVRVDTNGIPEGVFALFQMTFAIITPGLIIGAFPERVKFPFVIGFTVLWIVLVYAPAAHWVWGGGWLATRGVLDFAGGIVVHTTAGISALVCAIMIGPRRGFPVHLIPPHSPGFTMVGAGMLWVGWFGFNGGSALTADATAGSAILATHLSASAAALTWMAVEWLKTGKPTSIGIVTGAVAGLATITPASGYVGPLGALAIGGIAGVVCLYATVLFKQRFRIDDSLDVFAVHGVGGMLGSLLVAVFALPSLGGSGFVAKDATLISQFLVQVLGVGAVAIWSAIFTVIVVKLLQATVGLRVEPEEEEQGLDLVTHGERAYDND
ncbi:Ammonium transporter [uncultured Gammaproteobacteria bacterium]